jgi:hypothetical protein
LVGGYTVYTQKGGIWYIASSDYYVPKTFDFAGSAKTLDPSIGIPAFSVYNDDAKINASGLLELQHSVENVRVVSTSNGGWQQGSGLSGSSYLISGTDLGAAYTVYTYKAGVWYKADLNYNPYVPPTYSFTFASATKTLTTSVTAPPSPISSSLNADARINSGLLELQNGGVADIIVISASHGGWQNNNPVGNGSYQISGSDLGTYAVYTKKTGTSDWYEVLNSYYTPPSVTQIDFNTEYALLGLTSATDIQNQMDIRWSNAISTPFYQIAYNVTEGGINFAFGACLSSEPGIGFGFNSSTSELVIYGKVSSSGEASIKFDVAVIRTDGKGWLNNHNNWTSPMKSPGYDELFPSTGRTMTISLSDLTAGSMSSSLEGGYKIYNIVRELDWYPGIDCNTAIIGKTMNVISVSSF